MVPVESFDTSYKTFISVRVFAKNKLLLVGHTTWITMTINKHRLKSIGKHSNSITKQLSPEDHIHNQE